jgi:protein TonB
VNISYFIFNSLEKSTIMDLQITGLQFGIGTLCLAVVVIGIIVAVRQYLGLRQNVSTTSPRKRSEVNVLKSTSAFWRVGLICAVAFSILAFSWTTFEPQLDFSSYSLELEDEIENVPITTSLPKPPPPPPPPPIIEAVEEEIEEPPIFTDQSVTDELKNEAPKATPKKPKPIINKPLPPKPKVKEEIDGIMLFVEEMPMFPGCDGLGNYEERKSCSDKKMLEFIYNNVKYPSLARENGVEGTVVISFVIEKNGTISNIKILREVGAGCSEAATSVVEKMQSLPQKWIAGKQGNEKVRVQFNLPIKFKLN